MSEHSSSVKIRSFGTWMLSAEQPKVKVSSAGIPFQLLTLPYHGGSQQPTQDSFIHLVPIQAPTSADHRTCLHKPMSPFLLCSRGRQDPERWSQLNWNTSPQGAALAACTDHACVVARCLEVSQQPASLYPFNRAAYLFCLHHKKFWHHPVVT